MPEVARLTATAATTKIATSPVMSLCLSTSLPATPARSRQPAGAARPRLPGTARRRCLAWPRRAAASFPMRIT